ncbi:hypothetical protein [Streptacidiphilus sp. MAP5-3]|uniref:hypothetical protein n=1 Tax=unclassified Streptacidiphilus TaxID=2643834 RepID=UPI0035125012
MARDGWAASREPGSDDDLRAFAEPDDLSDAPLVRGDRTDGDDRGDEFELPDELPVEDRR